MTKSYTDTVLLQQLFCDCHVSGNNVFQHKMKNMVWIGGSSGLEGEFQSGSEVDFYIDNVS